MCNPEGIVLIEQTGLGVLLLCFLHEKCFQFGFKQALLSALVSKTLALSITGWKKHLIISASYYSLPLFGLQARPFVFRVNDQRTAVAFAGNFTFLMWS